MRRSSTARARSLHRSSHTHPSLGYSTQNNLHLLIPLSISLFSHLLHFQAVEACVLRPLSLSPAFSCPLCSGASCALHRGQETTRCSRKSVSVLSPVQRYFHHCLLFQCLRPWTNFPSWTISSFRPLTFASHPTPGLVVRPGLDTSTTTLFNSFDDLFAGGSCICISSPYDSPELLILTPKHLLKFLLI